MTLQRTEPTLRRFKGLGILIGLALCAGWGVLCGALRAPYLVVLVGGLAAAALAFWLERDALVTPETAARKDFRLILAAGFGFFAVLGVGLTALAALLSTWWLPRL